jgi:hypothetical protein
VQTNPYNETDQGEIPLSELQNRGVYKLATRSMDPLGVWDEAEESFIGIRHRRGDTYLTTEIAWAAGGTASALTYLDTLPPDIKLVDRTRYCQEHDKPVYYMLGEPLAGKPKWLHDDMTPAEDETFELRNYQPLLDYLDQLAQNSKA